MKFMNPAGLWLLLGIPVLIAIYLIKAQHEDRPVSSTYIWRLSSRFMKNKLPLQKFKKILAFTLQLLTVVTIAVLAARPVVENGEVCEYVLVIDSSASMQTEDTTGTSRFSYAIEAAETYAEKINEGHRISLIVAENSASTRLQGSTSVNEVKLTLRNLKCASGDCDAEAAMELASLLCDHADNAKVIFFTDTEYEAENVEVVNFNQNEWNVSLLSLTSQKSGKSTVFSGKLVSYHRDVTLTVGLRIDGVVTDAQILNCVSDTETEVTFAVEGLSTFDTAEVFVETSDALSLDNTYAVCRKNQKTNSVLLVSANPLYLESALNALGNCNVTVVGSIEEASLAGQDIYIFDGIYPEQYPTDGSVIQFGTGKLPDGVAAVDSFTAEAALSMNLKKNSVLYDNLSLKDAVVTAYSALSGNSYWEKLLYCEDNAVLVGKQQNDGTSFCVFSFDLHQSNLPLQMDFVLLMQNVMEYAAPSFLRNTDCELGTTVTMAVPSGAQVVYVEDPEDNIRTLSKAGNTASFTPEQPGIYTAVASTAEGGEYADFFVHISAEEVQTQSGGTLSVELSEESGENGEKAVSEVWFWIVLTVLTIILAEWGLYYYEQY